MKPGVRALGVAESFRGSRSTLCGAVVSGRGAVDGFAFTTCTVGGLDVTDAIIELWEAAGRDDVQYLLVNGVALAWYNVVELERLADAVPVPTLSITYEESDGLEDAIRERFSAEAASDRLDRYRSLPDRRRVELEDTMLFVRAIDADDLSIEEILETFIGASGRPEPLRVARLAARAADRWMHDGTG